MLGTHNSMTFGKPYHWYGWFMIPFARCQSKNLKEQFIAGARCFDIRVRFDKNGEPYFCHGLFRIKGKVKPALMTLERLAKEYKVLIGVRIILEDKKINDFQEKMFVVFCERFEQRFRNLIPFEGRRKGDWKVIYHFPNSLQLDQMVSSVDNEARWYEKFIPFAFACRKNQQNRLLEKHKFFNKTVLFDFL